MNLSFLVRTNHHQKIPQKFQVPNIEGFLNLIFGYFGGVGRVFPYIKPYPYSIGFRIPPFLVPETPRPKVEI